MLRSSVAVFAFEVAEVSHVDLKMSHPRGIHFRFVLGYVNHSRCFNYTTKKSYKVLKIRVID